MVCTRMPRLSVIIPAYNCENYIEKCVISVMKQSFCDLEILIVDDGSRDHTFERCIELAKKDERIKVIHQNNRGAMNARKQGIINASGKYITFMDSDDWIEPDAYLTIFSKMYSDEVDVVAFGFIEEYNQNIVRKINAISEGFYEKESLEAQIIPNLISVSPFFSFGVLPNLYAKIFKRELFKNELDKFTDYITVGDDADMVYQLLCKAKSLQIIDNCFYHYCRRNDSLMYKPVDLYQIKALYQDLWSQFKVHSCHLLLRKQLNEYMLFVMMTKCPKLLLEKMDRLENLSKKNIALYGAGVMGQAVAQCFKRQLKIWVDKDYEKYNDTQLPIEPIERLVEMSAEYDVIFIAIASSQICREVKNDLKKRKIEKPMTSIELNQNNINIVEQILV